MVLGKRMGTPQNTPTLYSHTHTHQITQVPLYTLIIVGLDILGEVYGVCLGDQK